MTTIPETEEATPETEAAPEGETSRYAVMFALEEIAGSARQATFEVLQSILGSQGAALAPHHISRYCLHTRPEDFMEPLLKALDASRQSPGKLVEDMKSGMALQLSSQSVSLPASVGDVLDAAREAGIELATLTALPQATAETLMETLGLNERGVKLVVMEAEDEFIFPRADNWLKLAKELGKSPMNCGVIATSQPATKAAVSAAMRCVAMPDTYTSFEDFGGANAIYDDPADMVALDVLEVLCPHRDEEE